MIASQLESIVLPTTGQWVGFLRETSKALAARPDRAIIPLADTDEGLRSSPDRWQAVTEFVRVLAAEGLLSQTKNILIEIAQHVNQ